MYTRGTIGEVPFYVKRLKRKSGEVVGLSEMLVCDTMDGMLKPCRVGGQVVVDFNLFCGGRDIVTGSLPNKLIFVPTYLSNW